MLMNKISEDMFKALLNGDMEEIAEKLTGTKVDIDNDFIIDGTNEDLKEGFLNVYINIANYINSHCTTSEKTHIINSFLYCNNSDDDSFEDDFNKLCNMLNLKPSNISNVFEEGSMYTYNYDNDLSKDFCWKIFEDECGYYYTLIAVHIGVDARSGFSDTVFLQLNDVEYFHTHTISGWVKETEIVYDSIDEILEDVVKINNGRLYNEDGHEILLSACLYY